MKYVYWFLGLLVWMPVLLIAIVIIASELRWEVVTLERAQNDGDSSRIWVWIVDNDDVSWIEHGDLESYWRGHLLDSNEVVLERGGDARSYEGTPDLGSHERYHDLRRQNMAGQISL
jgi:hypothetical protein